MLAAEEEAEEKSIGLLGVFETLGEVRGEVLTICVILSHTTGCVKVVFRDGEDISAKAVVVEFGFAF